MENKPKGAGLWQVVDPPQASDTLCLNAAWLQVFFKDL